MRCMQIINPVLYHLYPSDCQQFKSQYLEVYKTNLFMIREALFLILVKLLQH